MYNNTTYLYMYMYNNTTYSTCTCIIILHECAFRSTCAVAYQFTIKVYIRTCNHVINIKLYFNEPLS